MSTSSGEASGGEAGVAARLMHGAGGAVEALVAKLVRGEARGGRGLWRGEAGSGEARGGWVVAWCWVPGRLVRRRGCFRHFDALAA